MVKNLDYCLKIKNNFLKYYPNAKTELVFKNPFELLISIVLSAQCTDKRVNIITPPLFAKYPNLQKMAQAPIDDLMIFIKTCSFYKNKAKYLKKLSEQIINNFNSEIPFDRDKLESLAGVGRKTANVFLIELQNANFMAVDTHVFRVSHRLNLTQAKNVKQTEIDLTECFQTELAQLHQGMVLFGRYICKAIKPKCEECFLSDFCIIKKEEN